MFFTALLALALGADADVTTLKTREFMLPLMVDPARQAEIASIHLCVSTDNGKTWKQVALALPSDTKIVYAAPRDGTYWFAVQVTGKDGKTLPADGDLLPLQKVVVDTKQAAAAPPAPPVPAPAPPQPPVPDDGQPPREARKPTPEQRIADLEKQVAELKAALKQLEKRLAEAEKAR